MKKVEKFKTEIGYIKDVNVRKDLRKLISMLPDYFFEIPASCGKYHPKFANSKGGLLKHTKVVVRIGYELLNDGITGMRFTDKDKDLIIMALVLHDGLKWGNKKGERAKFDHPLLMSKLILENSNKLNLDIDDIRKVCSMIESHMGDHTVDPNTEREVLPRPRTELERFVHMCDHIASRKFLNINFNDGEIVE